MLPLTPAPSAPDHAAFFAAASAELAEARDDKPMRVPLSFKAASLAGLVVGCGLAGFDLTGSAGANEFKDVTSALGLNVDAGSSLVPAMILLGLVGGARSASLTLIVVQGLLNGAKLTSRGAYALGGAASAACLAAALFALAGHQPAHGWAVELIAGAASGFLYRVFAGTRPA